jgi:hypothetical protein
VRILPGVFGFALGALLLGCSFGGMPLPPTRGDIAGPDPPYRKLVSQQLPTIVGDPRNAGRLEISGLRHVDSLKGPAWLVCLTANANTRPRRYAILFQDEKIVESRLSVGTDRCEQQVFEPFGVFAASQGAIH